MITNEQRETIEKNWEDSYWSSSKKRESNSVRKLKEYFLEDKSTPYKIDISDEYILDDIILGIMNVVPKNAFDYIFYEDNLNSSKVKYIFKSSCSTILRHLPLLLEKYEEAFLFSINKLTIDTAVKARYIKALLEYDLKRYTPYLEEIKSFFAKTKRGHSYTIGATEQLIHEFYYELYKKYSSDAEVKELFYSNIIPTLTRYEYDIQAEYLLNKMGEIIDKEEYFKVVEKYCQKRESIGNTIELIKRDFPEDKNHFFEILISREPKVLRGSSYIQNERKLLYKALLEVDFESYYDKVISFTEKMYFDDMRYTINTVIKYKNKAFTYASENITSKDTDIRCLSYMILSALKEESSLTLLKESFTKEKNDKDVREIMLPILSSTLYEENISLEDVKKIVDDAKKRKKLDKWKEPFEEATLPALYFLDGSKLNSEEIRFLFYRMSMTKEMQSDIEAKLLLNHVDKSRSSEFATFILDAFLSNGSKAPKKYLMAFAGILGDETLLEYLIKIFNKVYEEKRMKMAQFVIGTIALVGTDKALRFIEFVSRKYKKKAALHEYCLNALNIAAKELGITADELSEKIIPDFGFDGLYRTIDVEGEEYRVFVAKDFKLQYINEDNKIRKSLPKGASKELKAELKTVQAEIRDVNKAGAGRLEQYMVNERRWNVEAWQKFYLSNPVMFIYASTLVWGLYDKNNNLKELFYIDEDSSMMTIEDDEIEFEESDQVGMVHPLRLTKEQIKSWKEHFYELDIVQPFKQLDRETFSIDSSENAKTSLDRFSGKEPAKGASAIKTLLEKRGYKKDVVDGGCIDFYKLFPSSDIYVDLGIYGINVVYYEGEMPEIGETTFRRIHGRWDERITLSEIPDMIFSETILDMELVMGK